MGMPKSRKKKAEPAQVNTGDASSSTAPQTTARPAEAAAQSCSEPSPPAFMSEDAPDPKKRRVVMYVEPGEVAVVRKEISLPPVPSGAYMQRVRDRELEEQRYHAALCNNLWCDCADRGVALLGQHDMFCQLYKCYAAEIGCCTLGRDSLDMDMHCMHKGIIIDYTPSLQMCAQPNFREGRHIRTPWPDHRMRYWPTPQQPLAGGSISTHVRMARLLGAMCRSALIIRTV